MAHEEFVLERLRNVWAKIESADNDAEETLESLGVKTRLLEEIARLEAEIKRQRKSLQARKEAALTRLAASDDS